MRYCLHHRELGLLQAVLNDMTFWYPMSAEPKLLIATFPTIEEAEKTALQIINAKGLNIHLNLFQKPGFKIPFLQKPGDIMGFPGNWPGAKKGLVEEICGGFAISKAILPIEEDFWITEVDPVLATQLLAGQQFNALSEIAERVQ